MVILLELVLPCASPPQNLETGPKTNSILFGWGGVIVVTSYLLVLVMRVMDLMINTEIVDCILQIKEKLISGPNFCLFYVDHSS